MDRQKIDLGILRDTQRLLLSGEAGFLTPQQEDLLAACNQMIACLSSEGDCGDRAALLPDFVRGNPETHSLMTEAVVRELLAFVSRVLESLTNSRGTRALTGDELALARALRRLLLDAAELLSSLGAPPATLSETQDLTLDASELPSDRLEGGQSQARENRDDGK